MIVRPANDRACLGQVTAIALDGLRRPDLHAFAARFVDTAELVAHIRSQPQTEDKSDPTDGAPRVQCDVSQRVRLAPRDPNCVERALLYLAAAELIDPDPVRQLATTRTASGLHTYPLEDGRAVILDPFVSAAELDAAAAVLGRNALRPAAAVASWVTTRAATVLGPRAAESAGRAFDALLAGRALGPAQRRALAAAIGAAERTAQRSPAALRTVAAVRRGVSTLLSRRAMAAAAPVVGAVNPAAGVGLVTLSQLLPR